MTSYEPSLQAAAELELRRRARARSIERWRNDPCLFAQEALRDPRGDPIYLWDRMIEFLVALTKATRVACKAGRKVSKTYTAAIIALWWVVTRKRGRVIITGPTERTIQTEIWRDVRELCRTAIIELPRCSPAIQHGMKWEDGREIRGFAADKPEGASGTSGDEQLYIVDEASGVSPEILDIVMGNLFGGGSLLMLSNPTQQEGFFADIFNFPERHPGWLPLTIPALDSPNVVERRVVVPGLTTHEAVEEARVKWGETSELWRVHILGELPGQGDNSIIGLGLILAAQKAYDDPDPPDPGEVQIGVDVARFGDDDSTLYVRRGLRIIDSVVVHGQDTVEVTAQVVRLARAWGRPGHGPVTVAVDDTGVGGGVTDQLRRVDGLNVCPVNAGRVACDEELYANTRTELWFCGRDWLKAGGKIPKDPELQRDLSACHYGFDGRRRFVAESKEAIKKRLGRSPDRADGFNLACYPAVARAMSEPLPVPQDAAFRWADAPGRGFG